MIHIQIHTCVHTYICMCVFIYTHIHIHVNKWQADTKGSMRTLDILQPEIFISFHMGFPKDADDPLEITPGMAQV